MNRCMPLSKVDHPRVLFWVVMMLLITSLFGIPASHTQAAIGDIDHNYDPSIGMEGDIQAIAVQADGKIVVGGQFSQVNHTERIALARLNTDGSLDGSFKSSAFDEHRAVDNLLIQSDGKLLVSSYALGSSFSYQLIRLNSDSSTDSSFTPINISSIEKILLQADGKIIIAGIFDMVADQSRNRLARFNSDGSLDTSFDPGAGANDRIQALEMQSDGKLLIGGTFTQVSGQPRPGLARLNSDGSLDTSYTSAVRGQVRSLKLQGEKLLLGGFYQLPDDSWHGFSRLDAQGAIDASFNAGVMGAEQLDIQGDGRIIVRQGMAISRLNADGSLDPNFNFSASTELADFALASNNTLIVLIAHTPYPLVNLIRTSPYHTIHQIDSAGKLNPDFSVFASIAGSIRAIAAQPDGKLLVAGTYALVGEQLQPEFVRLNRDGSIDSSFQPEYDGYISALAVQDNGQILLAGLFMIGDVSAELIRLNVDGSLDLSFHPALTGSRYVTGVTLQADGHIILTGTFRSINGESHNRIARLQSDGSLDSSFSVQIAAAPGGRSSQGVAILQADGKILVGGYMIDVSQTYRQGLARLNPDGSLDTSFDASSVFAGDDAVYGILVQDDGKVVISVSQSDFTQLPKHSRILRLNADGSRDTSFTVYTGINSQSHSFIQQSDGKILAAGYGLVRLNPGGSLDKSYIIKSYGCGCGPYIASILKQADGKVVVGGDFVGIEGFHRHALARLEGSPEIDVRGQGQSIASGATTPEAANGTDFGSVLPGRSITHTFTIHNTSASPLTLSGTPPVRVSGAGAADFEVTTQPGASIAAGASTSFSVRFSPGAGGLRSATLNIANDDSDENPYIFAIQGAGVIPEIELSGQEQPIPSGDTSPSAADGSDFGTVPIGQHVTHSFTIMNTGSAALKLTGSPPVSLSGVASGDFEVISQPGASIEPGASVSFSVRFTPAVSGLRSATISIASDDADENPYTFMLQGEGSLPRYVLAMPLVLR